jgi:translation initiation factor IF-2
VSLEKQFTEGKSGIRIAQLARELGVRSHLIVACLPELGVTQKKTHSSLIDLALAEEVRNHFRGLDKT